MATRQQLDEARVAFHRLQLGLAPRVVVDIDGSRVELTAANRTELAAYIRRLEAELGPCGASGAVNPSTYGPATFVF